ncbi:MAG: hypothetical protein R3F14_17465 [Polyangiaceae bacterium]
MLNDDALIIGVEDYRAFDPARQSNASTPKETIMSRIIAGYVGSAGNIVSSSPSGSFSVVRVGQGLYEVTFRDSFSIEPAAAATQIRDDGGDGQGANTKANVTMPILERSRVRFKTGNSDGNAVNRDFSFIVVGS